MTEAEWLRCTAPRPMLEFLLAVPPGLRMRDHTKADRPPDLSDRKLRLFACACYRRLWDLLPHPLASATVEVAERLADGLVTAEELGRAHAAVYAAAVALEDRWRESQGDERRGLLPAYGALGMATQACQPDAGQAA